MKHKVYSYSLFDPFSKKHFYGGRTRNIQVRYRAHLAESSKLKTSKDIHIQSIILRGSKPGIKIHYILELDNLGYETKYLLDTIEQRVIGDLLSKKHKLYNKDVRQWGLYFDFKFINKIWDYCDDSSIKPEKLFTTLFHQHTKTTSQ